MSAAWNYSSSINNGGPYKRQAVIYIGIFHFIAQSMYAFFFIDILRSNSRNDTVWSRAFDYSNSELRSFVILHLVLSLLHAISGILLVRGVTSETRIYYFPFFMFAGYQLVDGIVNIGKLTLRYGKYPQPMSEVAVLVLATILHGYLYRIVVENYKDLKRRQNPTLVLANDI